MTTVLWIAIGVLGVAVLAMMGLEIAYWRNRRALHQLRQRRR